MLAFTNPETAQRFTCLVEEDRMVHKAGLYSGPLSAVTPEMASAFIEGGTNLLEAIEATKQD